MPLKFYENYSSFYETIQIYMKIIQILTHFIESSMAKVFDRDSDMEHVDLSYCLSAESIGRYFKIIHWTFLV